MTEKIKFEFLPRGALTRMMTSEDRHTRRNARKQYAIWELLKLGCQIDSSSDDAGVIQFSINSYSLQFHPVHGKWFAYGDERINGQGLKTLRNCILCIKQKGGLPMPESTAPITPEWKDRMGLHIEILDNGYYVSCYGPGGETKTYRETADELEEFLSEKFHTAIPALTLDK